LSKLRSCRTEFELVERERTLSPPRHSESEQFDWFITLSSSKGSLLKLVEGEEPLPSVMLTPALSGGSIQRSQVRLGKACLLSLGVRFARRILRHHPPAGGFLRMTRYSQ